MYVTTVKKGHELKAKKKKGYMRGFGGRKMKGKNGVLYIYIHTYILEISQ